LADDDERKGTAMKTKAAADIRPHDRLKGIAGMTLKVTATLDKHDGQVHILVKAQVNGIDVNAQGAWKTFKPTDRLQMAK
jgi:hypothetical protein